MLCRGIRWPSAPGTPYLALEDSGQREHDVLLEPGTGLGFTVVPGRWCLGHQLIHDKSHRTHVPCRAQALLSSGTQCPDCVAADESRPMHDFHRSGRAGSGLRDYLAQPHWLYIATFADGTTKVGTASEPSKWRRLAEQGALVARYVALARDGSVVRHLEDSVSTNLPPTQFVRGAAKFAALLHPRPPLHLEQTNKAMASVVRDYVGGLALEGFHTVDEQWERSVFSDAVAGPSRRAAYPQPLDSGAHGIRLDSMLGLTALVGVDDVDGEFLLDLGALKGRKIRIGEYTSTLPALQELLF